MDNLSHALSGLAAGELIHRCLPLEPDPGIQTLRRRLLLLTGLLAANFPDLDLVLTSLLPAPLGYLLHHRGHTHTFLYAIPQALLLAALLLLLWPAARRMLAQSSMARRGFGLSLSAGFLLHILMDYLNSYGVHPFHPLNSRWLYGDMVFIIEPVFWVTLGIPLFMMLRPRWLALPAIAALMAVIGYFTQAGFLPWISFAVLAALAALLAITQLASGERGLGGLLAGLTACLLFIGVQALASDMGKRIATQKLHASSTGTRVLDVAMTPFPAYPLCWMFASVEYDEESYRARRGVLSLAPEWRDAADCPPSFVQVPDELQDDYSAAIVLSTYRGDLDSVRALYEQDCRFRAWMRFARIPVLEGLRAWDLRFERGGPNFTSIDLGRPPPVECPPGIPQWGTPRQDLLSGPR